MIFRKFPASGRRTLRRAVRDFLGAWTELATLIQFMDEKGLTGREKGQILDAALQNVVEQAPCDGREQAAQRVRELIAWHQKALLDTMDSARPRAPVGARRE